jgi:hypothetical protein
MNPNRQSLLRNVLRNAAIVILQALQSCRSGVLEEEDVE